MKVNEAVSCHWISCLGSTSGVSKEELIVLGELNDLAASSAWVRTEED